METIVRIQANDGPLFSATIFVNQMIVIASSKQFYVVVSAWYVIPKVREWVELPLVIKLLIHDRPIN